MGNRAVIAFDGQKTGIYLHWNGGLASILAFLKVAKTLNVRASTYQSDYTIARMTQIIGNFFGGTLSLGVGALETLDLEGDNGVYWIKDWEIVRRENVSPKEAKKLTLRNLNAIDKKKYTDIVKNCMEANSAIFAKCEDW